MYLPPEITITEKKFVFLSFGVKTGKVSLESVRWQVARLPGALVDTLSSGSFLFCFVFLFCLVLFFLLLLFFPLTIMKVRKVNVVKRYQIML